MSDNSEFIQQLEQDVAPILAQMEQTGLPFNVEYLQERKTACQEAIDKLTQELFDYLIELANPRIKPAKFNVNSYKQVGLLLYDILALEPLHHTHKGSSARMSYSKKPPAQHGGERPPKPERSYAPLGNELFW